MLEAMNQRMMAGLIVGRSTIEQKVTVRKRLVL